MHTKDGEKAIDHDDDPTTLKVSYLEQSQHNYQAHGAVKCLGDAFLKELTGLSKSCPVLLPSCYHELAVASQMGQCRQANGHHDIVKGGAPEPWD